jgi:hypothetical protein|tara:strand:- start:171 stop:563 length:393 start_codon:yes stop_codon:yes gene_type:complete
VTIEMAAWYGPLADLVVAAHAAFVLFVVAGGLLVFRRPTIAWVHLPAVAWGVGIEWVGGICPLTPLEHWLRGRAGDVGYSSDFIQHYLLPVLYPAGLTREIQIALGAVALGVNVGLYAWCWRRRRAGAVG